MCISHVHTRTLKHTLEIKNVKQNFENSDTGMWLNISYCHILQTLFKPFNISLHYPFTEQNIYFCLSHGATCFQFSQRGETSPNSQCFPENNGKTRQLHFLWCVFTIPSIFLVTSSKKNKVGNVIVWDIVCNVIDHWHHIDFFVFTKENVADLVLHLQCIDIQKATFITIGSHTVQHYQRGARRTIQTRE